MIRYLLDTHIGVFEQIFDFESNKLIYPLMYRFAGKVANNTGEMLGRDVQLLGIELHAALFAIVF